MARERKQSDCTDALYKRYYDYQSEALKAQLKLNKGKDSVFVNHVIYYFFHFKIHTLE